MITFPDVKLSKGQHIVPYRPEHLLDLDLRDYEKDNYKGHIEEYLEYVHLNTVEGLTWSCLLYTSPSPRDSCASRMPSSA